MSAVTAQDDGVAEKSAQTAELSTTHSPLGTHGLWGDENAQLPAYVQNIAKAMMRNGHDESSAIALAVGAVKRWAAGRGKVTPEVRAAAGKALAEWEKLKAEHSKSKSLSAVLFALEEPDVVKVGPEGYEHGWICVRPPCGSKPGKLKRGDLQVKRDGNIMHRSSGWGIGHVGKGGNGKFTATHSDGHISRHQNKETAIRALANHYNSGKTKRDFSEEEKKKPASNEERGSVAGNLRPGDKIIAAFGGPPSDHVVISADHDDKGNVKLTVEDGSGARHAITVSADDEISRASSAKPSAGAPLKALPGKKQDAGNELRGDDALKVVSRPSNLTSDEKSALSNYGFTAGYTTVNPYLHHDGQVFDKTIMGYWPAKPGEKKLAASMISGMDSAFAKATPLPQSIVVHRGTGNVDDMFGKPGSLVGKAFNAKAYTSTTTVPGATVGNGLDYESKPGKIEIHVPVGSKVLPGNDFEKEVILPRNASFHVLSDEIKPGGQRHIKLMYEPASSPSKSSQLLAEEKKKPAVAAAKPAAEVKNPAPTASVASPISAEQADEAERQADRISTLGGLGGKSTQLAVIKKSPIEDLQAADYGFQQRAAVRGNPGKVTAAHQMVRDEIAKRGGKLADLNQGVRQQSAAEVAQRERKALITAWTTSYRYKGTTEAKDKRIADFATEMHRLLSTNKPPVKCGSGCQDAHKFIAMIDKEAAPQKKETLRGLTLSGTAADRMFKPGKSLDMPVSSWTNDPSVADLYAKCDKPPPGKVHVILHAAPGANGVDISSDSMWHGAKSGAGAENEIVTGGRFNVDSVKKDGDIMHVYLTQKDFSAH